MPINLCCSEKRIPEYLGKTTLGDFLSSLLTKLCKEEICIFSINNIYE